MLYRPRGLSSYVDMSTSRGIIAIIKLNEWLEEQNTNPDLSDAMIQYLTAWRGGYHPTLPPMFAFQEACSRQKDICLRVVFEGWVPHDWASLQLQHFLFLKSRRTGNQWLIALIKQLWIIARDLWNHRSGILHNNNSTIHRAEHSTLDAHVRRLYVDIRQLGSAKS